MVHFLDIMGNLSRPLAVFVRVFFSDQSVKIII